jgi:hypothetical protein
MCSAVSQGQHNSSGSDDLSCDDEDEKENDCEN